MNKQWTPHDKEAALQMELKVIGWGQLFTATSLTLGPLLLGLPVSVLFPLICMAFYQEYVWRKANAKLTGQSFWALW